jgi:DNA polymerase-3 subunit gamma/tau
MPYEVLARKWRPQVFQDVIGQEHVTQTLTNAIKTDRLAHAYLFSGARGVGKTSVARILAKAINCEQGEPGTPCNKCQSCVEIIDGSSVDVQEIDGASNRGIDEIRDLRENTRYMPSSSKYRIYIIDEVHMLTLPAFNALLKTLEEPPAHVKFIFATTEYHKVPMTILSRCQRFDFKRIPVAQLISQLEKIGAKEGIEISKSGLAVIATEAEGSMRDAEGLLDQVVSFTGQKVEDRHVIEILGIIDRDIMMGATRAIIEGSPKECLEIVDQIYNYGYDIKEFYRALMGQFRNLLISLIVPQNSMLDLSESEQEEVSRLAERAGSEKIQALMNLLINREEDLRFTSHPRLILEATMIKLCHLGDVLSFGDLLDKIESLEKRLLGTLASGESPEINRLSDTSAQWVSDSQQEDHLHSKDVNENALTWDDFLTYLSSKSKVMFNILKDWHFQKLNDRTLEIVKGGQSFSLNYFEDTDKYNELSNYCRDFFKRNIKVRIVGNSQVLSKTKSSASTEQPRPEAKIRSDLPSPVQDILHMFQGEIIGGSPAKRAAHGNPDALKKKQEVTE